MTAQSGVRPSDLYLRKGRKWLKQLLMSRVVSAESAMV